MRQQQQKVAGVVLQKGHQPIQHTNLAQYDRLLQSIRHIYEAPDKIYLRQGCAKACTDLLYASTLGHSAALLWDGRHPHHCMDINETCEHGRYRIPIETT